MSGRPDCVGDTHEPVDRQVGDVRVVDPGSVSNPLGPDSRASYAVLEASHQGYEMHHRKIDYDHDGFIKAVRDSHHPVADSIIDFQLGRRPGKVPHEDHRAVTIHPS